MTIAIRVALHGRQFCLPGNIHQYLEMIWLSELGGRDIWQVEGTVAPNHPAIHRTAPTTKKYPA